MLLFTLDYYYYYLIIVKHRRLSGEYDVRRPASSTVASTYVYQPDSPPPKQVGGTRARERSENRVHVSKEREVNNAGAS